MAPEDYISASGLLIFGAGDDEKCHTVQIVNNDICEDAQEQFTSDLTLVSGIPLITVNPGSAQVVINDINDCRKCSLYKFLPCYLASYFSRSCE